MAKYGQILLINETNISQCHLNLCSLKIRVQRPLIFSHLFHIPYVNLKPLNVQTCLSVK